MDINQMHILFRTLGQQMGLQQVRGILPESIDTFLNVAINEKCRSVLQQNASTPFKDKITVQNNYVTPINALSTLYCSDKKIVFTNAGDCREVQLDTLNNSNVFQFISFFVAFSKNGNVWHRPCRLIEFDKLPMILSDECSKADNEYPIISLYTSVPNGDFIGKLYLSDYTNLDSLVFNYIKHPKEVSYDKNINCDLPDYLHTEIVELAVQKFFQSVGSTTKPVQ